MLAELVSKSIGFTARTVSRRTAAENQPEADTGRRRIDRVSLLNIKDVAA
jgi:hypothetical protein